MKKQRKKRRAEDMTRASTIKFLRDKPSTAHTTIHVHQERARASADDCEVGDI
jgi:hypothetical protein